MKLHPESAKLFEVDEAVEKAKNYALRLLSGRAYTKKEVRDKLVGREHPERAIEETLAMLTRLHLLDDRTFAQRFVEDRLRLRPAGRMVLQRDLKRRGVPAGVIDEVLDEALEAVDSTALALDLLKGRIRRYRGLPRDKALGRMYGFLGRRGFEAAVAREVAQIIWEEIESDTRTD